MTEFLVSNRTLDSAFLQAVAFSAYASSFPGGGGVWVWGDWTMQPIPTVFEASVAIQFIIQQQTHKIGTAYTPCDALQNVLQYTVLEPPPADNGTMPG